MGTILSPDQYRNIFDKAGIRMLFIRFEPDKSQSTFLQRRAISCVLFECAFVNGSAERDSGQPPGKVRCRAADYGVGEHYSVFENRRSAAG
jgi:hypothetical protein